MEDYFCYYVNECNLNMLEYDMNHENQHEIVLIKFFLIRLSYHYI